MAILNQLRVGDMGPFMDGSIVDARGGRLGEGIVSELNGRFFEQTYRGNMYSTGMQLTSISNATFTTADALSGTLATAATATPVVGIWNPMTSTINAAVLQATLGVVTTALTATGCGGFVWAVFTGNSAITVASQATPVNRRTLAPNGSQVKGLSGLALTGLVATGNFLAASSLGGGSVYNVSELATAAGFHTQQVSYTENIDGSIIVPPGGILGLFCSTTPVAQSAVSSITWEEVPTP
jgi:hypothetical protein